MCWRIYFCGSALHLCHMKVITVEPWVAFRPPSSPKWGSSKGREARTSPHRARGILHPVCSVLLRIRGRLRYNDEKRWNMKEDTEIVNKRIWMRSHAALYSFRSIDWLVASDKDLLLVDVVLPLRASSIIWHLMAYIPAESRKKVIRLTTACVELATPDFLSNFKPIWRNHCG